MPLPVEVLKGAHTLFAGFDELASRFVPAYPLAGAQTDRCLPNACTS